MVKLHNRCSIAIPGMDKEDLTQVLLFVEFIKQVGGKEIKCEACRAFYLFFATSLINSIIQ